MNFSLPWTARAVVSITIASFFCAFLPSSLTFREAQAAGPAGKAADKVAALPGAVTRFAGEDSGQLAVVNPKTGQPLGKCPLKKTSVSAQVSGYVSRVTVKQLFENPFKEKIEAVYTFPLSETGAVDDMLMRVGSRTIRGAIKRREEARKIYEQARDRGHVASLLDQERPNIFTQSVANIKPGEKVEITLRYVDLIPYESGSFSFAFPTVVGPRFNPGTPVGKKGSGWSPDTDAVLDGSRVTPPVTARGTRAGHDISITVSIDAGVPIKAIASKLHEITTSRPAGSKAVVALKEKETIPNKDFVLAWEVASTELTSGYLAHRSGQSGYFTIMLLPPKRVVAERAAPKEMIFLIDCSGSQRGAPLVKAKETMEYILEHMNAQDTFQVISFSDHLKVLFDKPQPASASMREKARQFIGLLEANGGTWMAPAVERACSIPADNHRLRIVTFMTDGYVGNDFEILGMVRKLRGTSRWFPFGTGNSVNRLLIDGMAREGGGEPEYVLLNSSGDEAGRKFYERIAAPVLTDVKIDFDGLAVKEVFPHQVSDVWAQRPLYIKGRYISAGKGTVTLSGFAGGKPYAQKLPLVLPEKEPANEVLASIWAKAKVDRLMSEDYFGAQRGSINKEIKEEIIKTALDHHLMTQYTSFVAVEETIITDGGKPRTVAVPVEMPEGVSYEGVFGETARAGRYLPKGTIGLAPMSYASMSTPQHLFHYGGTGGAAGAGGLPRSRAAAMAGVPAYRSAPRPLALIPPSAHKSADGHSINDSGGQPPGARKESANIILSDQKERQSEVKLDARLRAISSSGNMARVGRLRVRDGKVRVQVWLSDSSEAVLKKLKAAGLQIIFQPSSSKMVIGRIAVKKLLELASIEAVRFIEPAGSLNESSRSQASP